MNREAIYAALFARIAKAPGLVISSRRLRLWSDVAPEEQPALFLTQKREIAETTPGLNTLWRLECDVVLYARTTEGIDSPASILNPLVDAIAATLAPDAPHLNKCTLGGLVQHAWIEGAIETDEGTLGEQGVCVIPIVMLVA